MLLLPHRRSASLEDVRLGRGDSGMLIVPVVLLVDIESWLSEGTISLMTEVIGVMGFNTWPLVKDQEALLE